MRSPVRLQRPVLILRSRINYFPKTATSRRHIWISFQPLIYLDMHPWLAWNLIAQVKVKFTISPRLPWNTQSSCVSLLSGGITGMCHHVNFYPLTISQLEFKVGAFKPWQKFGSTLVEPSNENPVLWLLSYFFPRISCLVLNTGCCFLCCILLSTF